MDDIVISKAPVREAGQCYLLQQAQDLLTTLCKKIRADCVARVACTCRTLRQIASSEEVWRQQCPQDWHYFFIRPLSTTGAGAGVEAAILKPTSRSNPTLRVTSEWREPYASWRSLAIACYTCPRVQDDCCDSEVRRMAGAQVARGNVVHADIILCQRCSVSEHSGVWLEICVLLGHVLADSHRLRRALFLAVSFLGPRLAADDHLESWMDTVCQNMDGDDNILNYSFIMSMVNHAQVTISEERREKGSEDVESGAIDGHFSALESSAKVQSKVFAVALAHNENARLDCRNRAATLLFQRNRPATDTRVELAEHNSSSSSSSSDEEMAEEEEEEEDTVSWVASACMRQRALRACAEKVAVHWMLCACDLAHFSSPFSRSPPRYADVC